MQDIANKTNFFDAVVEETRAVDVHYQLTEVGKKHTFLSKEHYFNMNGTYYVPFRSLFSKDLSNLMMAGRCMSCSHIALGGPRVMNTCGQMGIAVGYAASLCKKYKENPRAVGKDHIKELRKLIGYA
jgi:hypothetical protein